MTRLVTGILMGLGATLTMDLWNLFLKRAFGIRSLDYCLLGRWVRHMPATFRHAAIANAPKRSKECATGWVAHYSIGISLAVVFSALVPHAWIVEPTLPAPLVYGIATVVMPFFVLQPCLGLGIASAKTSRPGLARIKSLATHTVFGFGLWAVAAMLARYVAVRRDDGASDRPAASRKPLVPLQLIID